jgi:hypothetical protein
VGVARWDRRRNCCTARICLTRVEASTILSFSAASSLLHAALQLPCLAGVPAVRPACCRQPASEQRPSSANGCPMMSGWTDHQG